MPAKLAMTYSISSRFILAKSLVLFLRFERANEETREQSVERTNLCPADLFPLCRGINDHTWHEEGSEGGDQSSKQPEQPE